MKNASQPKRLSYLDNLRTYLTILVIWHHATLAYGGNGGWGIRDTITDEISPILFTIFNALNQSYFMTAFFLLAGYFTPRSLERKGNKSFLMDRVIRLGIPLLIYTTLITNLNEFLISKYYLKIPFQFGLRYDPGHLWFLQLLFLFAIIYVILKSFKQEASKIENWAFPSDGKIWIAVVFLSLLTFSFRLAFPIGETIINIQPAHTVHYMFAFFIGLWFYRADWFEKLSISQGKRWGSIALLTFPFLIVLMILGGVLESDENIARFLGGFTWQAMAYSIWESVMMVALIIFLIYFFREKINHAGKFIKMIGANVYTVYIIHQTILYSLNVVFLTVAIPSYVKFFAVSIIAVPLCFLLSNLIRKLPYAKRVLG